MFSKKIIYASKIAASEIPSYPDGTKLVFHYAVEFAEDGGDTIEDSRKPYPDGYGAPMELIIGKKFKIDAWETCLKTMRVSEVSRFTLPIAELHQYPYVSKQLLDIAKARFHGGCGDEPVRHSMCGGMMAQTGMGYPALDALMADPKPLNFTFELLRSELPGDYKPSAWQLGDKEALASLPALRDEARAKFMTKDYAGACQLYVDGLNRIDNALMKERPHDDTWTELDQAKIVYYLNIAQCKLCVGEHYDSITAATEALSRDPTSEKALYRRAKARAAVWDFDAAREDLQLLKKHHPNLTDMVRSEVAKISAVEKGKNDEAKGQLKSIFA